jgi:colicin import membrane protein
MPIKKKKQTNDKSIKQSINIKIGDLKPKTKRVQRIQRKSKTVASSAQPETKIIYQTGLSRDINAYTEEVNKRNQAIRDEQKLKAEEEKKKIEEDKKKLEEDKKKLEYDYKKFSVFNPEALDPKSTTMGLKTPDEPIPEKEGGEKEEAKKGKGGRPKLTQEQKRAKIEDEINILNDKIINESSTMTRLEIVNLQGEIKKLEKKLKNI